MAVHGGDLQETPELQVLLSNAQDHLPPRHLLKMLKDGTLRIGDI